MLPVNASWHMTQYAGIIDSALHRPTVELGAGITLFEQDILVQETAPPLQSLRPLQPPQTPQTPQAPGSRPFEASRGAAPKLELVAGAAPASHIERRAADESLVPPEAVEVLRVYAHAQHAGIRSLVLAQPAGFAVPFAGASGEPQFGLWGTVLAEAVREVARGAALTMGKSEADAYGEIVDALLKGLFEEDAPVR